MISTVSHVVPLIMWLTIPCSTQGITLSTIHSFGSGTDGKTPYGTLVQSTNGFFYGTTSAGGIDGHGTVFRMTTAGTVTILFSFTGGVDGDKPYAGVVQGNDDNFYGTTTAGGASGQGTVFRMTDEGTLTILYSFTGGTDGKTPYAGLIQGDDGNFYGTTWQGGSGTHGTVFKITPAGALTTLYTFTGGNDGGNAYAGLIQAADGNFYGTTCYGGTSDHGTAFKITPAGTFTTLRSFTGGADGEMPFAALVQGDDGNFYGSNMGGLHAGGTVFKITPAGTLTTLHYFGLTGDGYGPNAALVQNWDGTFWGTTAAGGTSSKGVAFKITPTGTVTILYSFTGGNPGDTPYGALVQGADANFYGMTWEGGANAGGTIFKIAPGSFTTLYTFTGGNDGGNSQAGLVQGTDGNFYGTTSTGARTNQDYPTITCGTVFKMTRSGDLTTIHAFDGSTNEGRESIADLTQGNDGRLYGTTAWGGSKDYGTTFRTTTSGVFSTTHQFGGGTDGANPYAGMIEGSDGNFYGTCSQSGISEGYGTVYKVTPGGTVTTIYSFTGHGDGSYPYASLIRGSNGYFYGTTRGGGLGTNYGSVFNITTNGTLTTLHTFKNGDSLGYFPRSRLVQGRDGNFYGTARSGGLSSDYGTVFKMTPDGTVTRLYSFTGGTDGAYPCAGLIEGPGGDFYGTTSGFSNFGTVFKITTSGVLTTLYRFTASNVADGGSPEAPLVQGKDGNLYGITYDHGANGEGTVFRLSNFAPSIVNQPTNATCMQGNSASFSVVTDGSTPLKFQWRCSGIPLPNATNSTVVIENVGPDKAGNYDVIVSNPYGVITTSGATLTVLIDQGTPNRALSLDGTGDFVLVPDSPELRLVATSFTVEAWIFLDRYNTTYNSTIAMKSSTTNGGWRLIIDGNGKLGFVLGGGSPYTPRFWSANVVNTGAWHHVATVYTYSTHSLKIYLDGILDAETNDFPVVVDDLAHLRVGINNEATAGDFKGLIDELRIWQVAIEASNLVVAMQSQLTGAESDLVACFTFNNGTGCDISAFHNNGTFQGNASSVSANQFSVGISSSPLGVVEICFVSGFPLTSYQVLYSSDLFSTNWHPVGVPVYGTGKEQSIFDATTEVTQRFYRVSVTY